MPKSEILQRALNWAEAFSRETPGGTPPVDLFAVARSRGIKSLSLRPIIPKGILLPVRGGFEVYLQDSSRTDFDLSQPEPTDALTLSQRMALAHEISHTRFYKMHSHQMPTPDGPIINGMDLEEVCDKTGGVILLPTNWLRREIPSSAEIDSSLIASLVSRFRAPAWVVIERLGTVERSNLFERCILLVVRRDASLTIRAFYFGDGLLPLLPKPKIFTRVTDWLPQMPANVLDGERATASTMEQKNRVISFSRTVLSGQDFLLQVDAVPKSLPNP